MADNVHANLEDLRRLKAAVLQAERDVQDALGKVAKSLSGADWKDRARQDFESRFGDAKSAGQRVGDALHALEPILNKKINDLERYLG